MNRHALGVGVGEGLDVICHHAITCTSSLTSEVDPMRFTSTPCALALNFFLPHKMPFPSSLPRSDSF